MTTTDKLVRLSCCPEELHVSPDGDLVGYEEADALIRELQAENERLREQLRLANIDACNAMAQEPEA